jgi:hypothetical protein
LSNEEKTNDYENFEKGMIYMKILKKRGGGSRENGGGGNEIHAPCTCVYGRGIDTFFKQYLFAVQRCRLIYMNFFVKSIFFFEIKSCSSLNMIKLCSTKRQE